MNSNFKFRIVAVNSERRLDGNGPMHWALVNSVMAFFLVETGDCILERPGGAIGVSEQLGNCFLKLVFYSLETKKEKKKHI